MKTSMTPAALLLVASAASVQAQATSSSRIPIRKDVPATSTTTSGTANGTVGTMPTDVSTDTTNSQWGWYTPTTASSCSSVDMSAAQSVAIKTDLYQAGSMI